MLSVLIQVSILCRTDLQNGERPAMAENNREITADSQVARIFEWRRGFNTIHLIDIGVHLGLFQALVEKPGLTGRDLAERLGLHAPYVEVWCKTAYGLEILDADNAGSFKLAPYFDLILASPTHPRYLGGYVRLGTEVAAEDFRRCREALSRSRAGAITSTRRSPSPPRGCSW
jgi:hypothetical protein